MAGLLGGLLMKQAIRTSLLGIAMKSASGFAGYLDQVEITWGMLVGFSDVAVTGILAGRACWCAMRRRSCYGGRSRRFWS